MSKAFPPHDPAKSTTAAAARRLPGFGRVLFFGLIISGLALLLPSLSPFAQHVKDSQSPLTVTGIGARQSGGGTIVTVAADGPLNRTQTWQEGDRFHLVLPYAAGSQIKNLPRGVRVSRVSNSLEIIVNMKSGASVTVDPRFNHLNLIVNGGLNPAQSNDADSAETAGQGLRSQERVASREAAALASRTVRERSNEVASEPRLPLSPGRSSTSAETASSTGNVPARLPAVSSVQTDSSPSLTNKAQAQTTAAPAGAVPAAAVVSSPAASNSTQLAPANDDSLAPANESASTSPAAAPPPAAQSGGLFSAIFSTTGVAIIITLGLLALVFLRLRPSFVKTDKVEASDKELAAVRAESAAPEVKATPAPVAKVEKSGWERRKSLRRKNDKRAAASAASAQPAQSMEQQSLEVRTPSSVGAPAVFYGAYRVDQEVGKLVLGQPHRMDVLSSRAPDDRRAIETSLLKTLNAPEADADGRRRARQALEEYGFLARHSAALLLAQDACDRAAAARVLGEVAAPIALPFLLEALYDSEAIVRTQAVSSIGALRLPSAIGALLDMARRHPDMPSGPLSQALSACSLDCLDIGGVFEPERQLLYGETETEFNGEIKRLEPSANYEQLPEFLEDETLAEALERLGHTDVEVRAAAARRLAQFQSQSSVAALTALATSDPEAVVRTAAVTSLSEIDHESVFAPVLMAFADEAREVQAAAARSLSRLSFNRADAYVRIIETADTDALVNVARACIKARMAAQAIDRLASQDRRQAYEAFSMLSLLAKARETAPILEAITEHRDPDVQLAAIRLLGITGGPEVAQQFRQLAVRDGMSEKVRTALLEVVYKLDQTLPV